jgi:hypothetical protein
MTRREEKPIWFPQFGFPNIATEANESTPDHYHRTSDTWGRRVECSVVGPATSTTLFEV